MEFQPKSGVFNGISASPWNSIPKIWGFLAGFHPSQWNSIPKFPGFFREFPPSQWNSIPKNPGLIPNSLFQEPVPLSLTQFPGFSPPNPGIFPRLSPFPWESHPVPPGTPGMLGRARGNRSDRRENSGAFLGFFGKRIPGAEPGSRSCASRGRSRRFSRDYSGMVPLPIPGGFGFGPA